ncbi:MAG: ComEC/Rec2 family competence protein [Verrucomicrobia subdivision 3 bacterium]|nr:ComEC/Rec2 family competence protein [Limisphaerales bacterium]
MRRPFAWPATLFTAGILLGDVSAWNFAAFGGLALALTVAGLAIPFLRAYLLAGAIIAAGGAALSVQTQLVSPDDLRRVAAAEPRIVTLRGVLTESPYYRFHERGSREQALTKLDADAVRFGGAGEWQRVRGRIAVTTPGLLPEDLWRGQQVEITGVLAPPEGPRAPGLFDYRTHLRRLGIYYTLRAGSPQDWVVRGSLQPPPTEQFHRWAKRVLARGLREEDEALRLLWAMTLGWKTALSGEVSEPFMRSGTLHVFAISGLHVALIAAIAAGVLRGVRVSRRVCGLVVIPLIWFYTAATGWQASAVRSAVMATVVLGSWVLLRPPDLLNSFAAAAFFILLFDPQQLFQAGFQLSFAVVFFLALMADRLGWHEGSQPSLDAAAAARTRLRSTHRSSPGLLQRIAGGDPLVAWEVRPWWEKWALNGTRYIAGMTLTSLAAWLGSLPLIALYFHLITPVSLLANLVVVPLSGAALASNLAALLFAWSPFISEVFNHSAWLWMRGMIVVSEWTARWPGGAFAIASPGPYAIAFYYVTIVALLNGWLREERLRWWAAGLLAVLGIFTGVEGYRQSTRTNLTVLPLNAGHAVFFDAPGTERDLLIDCGDDVTGSSIVKPFLQAHGVRRIGTLILSHGDDDHVGGGAVIWDNFAPQKVIVPGVPFRSPVYRNVVRTIGNTNIVEVTAGARIGTWSVLYPTADDKLPLADDKALVLQGEVNGFRVLLLPDLSVTAQRALVDRSVGVRSDVVITSPPLRDEPLIDPLLAAIAPRLIILADATYPPNARARPRLRERLARHGVPVWYTTETFAVSLRAEADGLRVVPTRLVNGSKPFFLTGESPIRSPDQGK